MMTTASLSEDLEKGILVHPALHHPFLVRFAREPLELAQVRAFGLQHYQLVRVFTTYMTNILARRPDWTESLRPILDDEFGGHTIFRSHVHLYRKFLLALGLRDEDWGKVPLLPETKAFIDEHLELTRSASPLEALGAIGPGHETSIPVMFPYLLEGLRRRGIADHDLEYFPLHITEDKHHAGVFNALIARSAPAPESFERVRRGAFFSLNLRRRFWDGCERAVFGGHL